MSVVIPFILDVRLVDAPAGITQEEGQTGFLPLPSAVLALIFITRRIQPSLSLVDHKVEFCVPMNESFSICCFFVLFCFVLFCEKIPVRVTTPRSELTSQCQRVSRFPTEQTVRPGVDR